MTDSESARIVDLYLSGLAMRKVAGRVGRSYGAVNLVLHREGIKINPRGGYRRIVKDPQ
jgi:transposase